MRRTCSDCSKELGMRNRSGLCRSCLARRHNADPAVTARRKAAIRARFDDPEVLAAHRARIARYMANMPPEHRAARQAHGQAMYREVLCRPDIVAKREAARQEPGNRRRRGEKLSASRLPWCPAEWRPLYRDLTRKGVPPADARSAVEAEIKHAVSRAAAAERARLSSMTALERQLERVRAGVAVIPRFNPRRADPAFTLGGVAPEAL